MLWKLGQRVVSRHEPELGYGLIEIIDIGAGSLQVRFVLSDEERNYSLRTAPLLPWQEGSSRPLRSFSHDPFGSHLLRREALRLRSAASSQSVAGLVGPRIVPLPHQLYLAHNLSRRWKPRAILADEVGLGKTIEAGLVLSALNALDRVQRVLVVVPDALLHQWVHEMAVKFGESLTLIDTERRQLDLESQGISSFRLTQRAIAPLSLFVEDPESLADACQEKWDLIIIDEAHHLDWDEEDPSKEWLVGKALSEATNGLLLLTATPRQYGLSTQFGLLSLLNPRRFSDYAAFEDDAETFSELGRLAHKIAKHQKLTQSESAKLEVIFKSDPLMQGLVKAPEENSEALLSALVDRHPTGRFIFRNRRSFLQNFGKRVLCSEPLACPLNFEKSLLSIDVGSQKELLLAATGKLDLSGDTPKIAWLCGFLKLQKTQKVLVICSTKSQLEVIQASLEKNSIRDFALFHEDMPPIERDRQAALFTHSDTCSLLLCTDLGSEGRNFQCSHKLVLMDLPSHPDLLTQRIGRLDRIGQKRSVEIFVPYYQNTPEEAFFRWYDEGLNVFSAYVNGANILLEACGDDLVAAFAAYLPKHSSYKTRESILDRLIKKTQKILSQQNEAFEASVDIMLDLNSYNPEESSRLLGNVENCDDDPSVELFMRSLFDHYAVDYEDVDDSTIVVRPDSLMFIENLPGLPHDEEFSITFDRDLALRSEHAVFVSCDHPIIDGMINYFSTTNEGALSVIRAKGMQKGIFATLQVYPYAHAPKYFEIGRYLDLSAKDFSFDQSGEEVFFELEKLISPEDLGADEYRSVKPHLMEKFDLWQNKVAQKTQDWLQSLRDDALKVLSEEKREEVSRLSYLALVNSNISQDEVAVLVEKYDATARIIESVDVKIDSVCIAFCSS